MGLETLIFSLDCDLTVESSVTITIIFKLHVSASALLLKFKERNNKKISVSFIG